MSGATTRERLENARQDLHDLTDRVGGLPQESQPAVSEVLDELRTVLRELQSLAGALVRPSEDLRSTLLVLRTEHELYENLFDLAPTGYLLTDRAGTIGQANRSAELLLGVQRGCLVGRSLTTFVAEDHRDESVAQLTALEADETDQASWEARIQPEEGQAFDASLIVNKELDAVGRLVGLRWLVRDSAERMQREDGLHYGAAFLDQVSDAVISTDVDFNILSWNKGAEALYGFSEDEVIGKTVGEVTRLEYPNDVEEEVRQELLEKGYWSGEVIQARRDGRVINVVAWVRLLRDRSGSPIGCVSINRDITESKRAEEALRASEERFHLIADATPLPVVITRESDSTILYANRHYSRIIGLPVDQLIGRRSIDYYARASSRESVIEELSESGRVDRYEIECKREDGSSYWTLLSARLMQFDGQPAILTAFQDITELRKAHQKQEQALLRAEELTRAFRAERDALKIIMENTETHLAYLDREFNFLKVNSAYAKGSGYGKEELIGRNHFDLFPHAENQAIFERVRDTGEPIAFRAKPFVFPDRPELGTTYWDWSLTPTKDENGKVTALVLSVLDVTERERTQIELRRHRDRLDQLVKERTRALRASEERFRAIFEAAGMGIALLDSEGCMIATNPAMGKILGYTDEELRGAYLTKVLSPDDSLAGMDAYKAFLEEPEDSKRVARARRCITNDGQLVWANITVSPIDARRGQPRLAVVIVEDITGEKETQDALGRAEKLALAGKLAAASAHEINNPLQSVIGCLGLAEESLSDGEDITPYLEVGLEELKRAAGIVGQLRDLSRAVEPDQKEPTDVNTLLDNVLILSRKQCEDGHIDVVVETERDLPPVTVAPDQIEQVLLNLVLNAIDAMPDGGELRLKTTRTTDPDGISVSIADSGLGIPPDAISQLFEPFYTTKSDGLGLGLFVSENIVEEHGGRVDVDSRPGEGSTFRVWLPE